MRRFHCAMIALLFGGTAQAQVSTMGTTAMGIPSTPGAIVSSPLTGPGPFSAATQSGTPDTTLAAVPLALDPTIPGTSINCLPTQTISTIGATPMTSSIAGLGTIAAPAATSTATAPMRMGPSAIPPISGASATGTIAPIAPLGSSSMASACSSTPGGSSTNGAALPLLTPNIPAGPPPGTIQPAITELGGTSTNPTMTVIPTPNSAAGG